MGYKLTPGEIRDKFTAYRQLCDNRMVRARLGTKMAQVHRPAVYDMAGFCRFARLNPRTLTSMADTWGYKLAVHDIRCAILQRKLLALTNGEGAAGPLVGELDAIYGLQATKVRNGSRMQWQVQFNLRLLGGNHPAAPGAPIAQAVLERAGTIADPMLKYMHLHAK